MTAPTPSTGRPRRDRTTRANVKVFDVLARWVITVGGIGTIGAVLLVAVFLAWVVAPMFLGGDLGEPETTELAAEGPAVEVLALGFDEYGNSSWTALADGRVIYRDVATGAPLAAFDPFEGVRPTAASFPPGEELSVFGFADGTVRLARIGYAISTLKAEDEPPGFEDLPVGERRTIEGGVIERTPTGRLRLLEPAVTVEPAVDWSPGSALRHLDVSTGPTGEVLAGLSDDGQLRLRSTRKRTNLLTGETTVTLRGGEVDVAAEGAFWSVHLAGLGDAVLALKPDGELLRFDARNLSEPKLLERIATTDGVDVTAAGFLLGKSSLVIGDAEGYLRIWFPTKPDDAEAPDGIRLVAGHVFEHEDAAVTALAASARTRLLLAGFDDGSLDLLHATSQRLVGSSGPTGTPVTAAAILPKDDRVAALAGERLGVFPIDAAHPDITPATIFRPVWYEGYAEPDHVWQSSSGTDDFEPKFGLMPIIFGSLKATVYSMLFGVPLAILAAIYTSEFLSPKVRGRVKPTVEIMASLPSVVLGFLAALVVAPFVESVLPSVLLAFLATPFSFLLFARLWQCLPRNLAIRLEPARLPAYVVTFFAGVLGAALFGPTFERLLFGGDIVAWLDGQIESSVGGWIAILTPLCAMLIGTLHVRYTGERIRAMAATWTRGRLAVFDLGLFLASTAAAVLLAFLLGVGLDAVGFDPRGGVVDTYVQRNALVVGFMMGFAIIPIIYTIAEDALSAVPEHLRAASLGAGATRWQTATRVIVPTAMSGLFSAVMVGFGRAVGETMIVLMAAGNTPVMEWNVFNGLRTLSANIAVELPEAVRDSTHYRMLFLAALSLFAMTFVLNTVAEVIRSRFRKRAFQL